MSISGNMVGGALPAKTFIIEDENGNEFVGVVTDTVQVFTATDDDVRAGVVYAGDNGVSIGSKEIPTYHTCEGYKIITAGSGFVLNWRNSNTYDYTKLQCIICPFNSSINNSVAAEKVVIEDNVYEVNSSESISTVIKDSQNYAIDIGIVNSTSTLYIIRYFTYREVE